QEGADRLRRHITASRKSHVGMECAQIRLEAGGEDGFLDAFMQLEQMRMAGADSDPNDLRPALARKSSETNERKEERFPGDGAEFFRKRFLRFRGNAPEKTQGELHFARLEP